LHEAIVSENVKKSLVCVEKTFVPARRSLNVPLKFKKLIFKYSQIKMVELRGKLEFKIKFHIKTKC